MEARKRFVWFLGVGLVFASLAEVGGAEGAGHGAEEWLHDGDRAYELRFYSVADRCYDDFLAAGGEAPGGNGEILRRLLRIALARGNLERAGVLLDRLDALEIPCPPLLRYLFSVAVGSPDGEALATIRVETLAPAEVAWYYAAVSLDA